MPTKYKYNEYNKLFLIILQNNYILINIINNKYQIHTFQLKMREYPEYIAQLCYQYYLWTKLIFHIMNLVLLN